MSMMDDGLQKPIKTQRWSFWRASEREIPKLFSLLPCLHEVSRVRLFCFENVLRVRNSSKKGIASLLCKCEGKKCAQKCKSCIFIKWGNSYRFLLRFLVRCSGSRKIVFAGQGHYLFSTADLSRIWGGYKPRPFRRYSYGCNHEFRNLLTEHFALPWSQALWWRLPSDRKLKWSHVKKKCVEITTCSFPVVTTFCFLELLMNINPVTGTLAVHWLKMTLLNIKLTIIHTFPTLSTCVTVK